MKQTFDKDVTIKKFLKEEVAPETAKKWIMSANATGAGTEAATVVNKIKNILGEDSPQMAALRQEVLYDVLQPLLSDTPNMQSFVNGYDKLFRQNKSFGDAIFPDSTQSLGELRNMVAAIQNNVGNVQRLDMDTIISRALFGHGIAKAGLKVSLAGQAIRMIRGADGRMRSNQIMADLLGYDPRAPLIPIEFAERMGVMETVRDSNNGL